MSKFDKLRHTFFYINSISITTYFSDLSKKEFMNNFNYDLKDEQIFRNKLLITLKERNKSLKKHITEFTCKK